MRMLVVGATLAALVASPALAHARHARGTSEPPSAAYGAVMPFGSPDFAPRTADHVSGARAAAIRACSGAAARYTEYTWGDMEFQQYRACMAQHGQVE